MSSRFLFFVLFFVLLSSYSLACDFQNEFCDYNVVDWSLVTDFSFVDFSLIPHHAWGVINQGYIVGEKVSEIPVEHFNPSQIESSNLLFASSEQISFSLFSFENLLDLDLDVLSQVLSEEFNIFLDLEGVSFARFSDEILIGDFPSYDPFLFSRDDFFQEVVSGEVRLIPLNSQGELLRDGVISFGGLKSFDFEDGLFLITLGDDDGLLSGFQRGVIVFEDFVLEYNISDDFSLSPNGDFSVLDGFVKLVDELGRIKHLQGRFQSKNGVYTLFDYKGKQSVFVDAQESLFIQSAGMPLSIFSGSVSDGSSSRFVSYLNGNIVAKGSVIVSGYDFNAFLKNDAYFEKVNNVIRAEGFVEFSSFEIKYTGLSLTSVFTLQLDGTGEIIELHSSLDGDVGILEKKTFFGDASEGIGFLNEGVPLSFNVKKVNEDYSLDFSQDSLMFLSRLERDSNLVYMSGQDLFLGFRGSDKSLYVSGDRGVTFFDGTRRVSYISPRDSFKILGSDLDSFREVLRSNIDKKDISVDAQQAGIQKLFEMTVYSGVDVLDAFEEVKSFIVDVYDDSFSRNVMLTSFMLHNSYSATLSNKFRELESLYFESELFNDIKKNIYEESFIRDYLGRHSSSSVLYVPANHRDLSKIENSLFRQISRDSNNAKFYKDLFSLHLFNLILYEELSPESMFFHKDPEAEFRARMHGTTNDDVIIDVTNENRNRDYIINAYRALLFLEDLVVVDGETSVSSNFNSFSLRKFEIASGLAFEYAENGELGRALAVMDNIEASLESSDLLRVDEELYFILRNHVRRNRVAIADLGFNKIQVDLFGFLDEIERLMSQRMGWSERVSAAEGIGNKIATSLMSGGFGKNLLNSMGAFDRLKLASEDLVFEKSGLAQGAFVLNTLINFGASPSQVEAWLNAEGRNYRLNEELVANLFLQGGVTTVDDSYDFFSERFPRPQLGDGSRSVLFLTESNGDVSFIFNGEKHVVAKAEFEQVYGFVTDSINIYNARLLIHDSSYSDDVKLLIGINKVPLSSNYDARNLHIDDDVQLVRLRNSLGDFEFGAVGRQLNFVDEISSPAVLGLTAVSGYGGLTFSGASGFSGVGAALAEGLTIDLVLGGLVASNVDLSVSSELAAAVGVSLALKGSPRMMDRVVRNTRSFLSGRHSVTRAAHVRQINDFNKIKELDLAKKKFLEHSPSSNTYENLKRFDAWYTANFNPDTGKITLYRFVDDFPGLDDLVRGTSDLHPRGIIRHGSEDNLIRHFDSSSFPEFGNLIRKYRAGKDVSLDVFDYSMHSAGGFQDDFALYWTSNPYIDVGSTQILTSRKYRITVELDHNKAFRAGGLDNNRNWAGAISEEEWTTIGSISRDNVVEIRNLHTNEVLRRGAPVESRLLDPVENFFFDFNIFGRRKAASRPPVQVFSAEDYGFVKNAKVDVIRSDGLLDVGVVDGVFT
jgi:hypothetical protein